VTLEVRTLPVSELGNSAYLVVEHESNEAAVIDPIRDVDRVFVVGKEGEGVMQATEAARKLFRVGYDRVAGYLPDGTSMWSLANRPLTTYQTSAAADLAARLESGQVALVVDVREPNEWHTGGIPGSVNIPVYEIPYQRIELPRGIPVAVHCGHDYRATLGASLLERSGYTELVVVEDGLEGWNQLQ